MLRKLTIGGLTAIFLLSSQIPASAHYLRHKPPRSLPTVSWNDVKEHIAFCESGGRYNAHNRRSSASGKYQFMTSTWAQRYGVRSAYLATPAQQEQAALELHAARGLQPWRASRRCWERRMAAS